MMKRFLLLIILILTGCGGTPRYRTGGEEQPRQVVLPKSKYETDDLIRFGKILQSYLGKPYKGSSKYETGVDCSHFTQDVFKKFDGIELPRTAAEQFKVGKDVKYKNLAYGDLVFFRTSGRKISHVGIYIDERQFIHASSSKGVIISSLGEKYWAERYAGARRIFD